MNEGDIERKWWKKKVPGWLIAVVLLPLIVILILMCFFRSPYPERVAHRISCGANLYYLAEAVKEYAVDNNNVFPDPDKWCDLLVELTSRHIFKCKGAMAHSPEEIRDNFPGSINFSYYAINPNCTVNSPNDVVLLFETQSGWNQSGGREILTLDNHEGLGCNIAFVDGHVEWIKAEDVNDLKWE